jgi:hypothetical protein
VKTKPQPSVIANFSALPMFLTCAETRELLRCSERSLRRYYRGDRKPNGRVIRPILGYVQRGGNVLFAKAEIEKFLARRTVRVE